MIIGDILKFSLMCNNDCALTDTITKLISVVMPISQSIHALEGNEPSRSDLIDCGTMANTDTHNDCGSSSVNKSCRQVQVARIWKHSGAAAAYQQVTKGLGLRRASRLRSSTLLVV